MAGRRDQIIRLICEEGLLRFEQATTLRCGALTVDFVDVKRALASGADLEAACQVVVEAAEGLGLEFDAVGGVTMGADMFAHVVAVIARRRWFVVRKEAKGRGTDQRIEGAALGPGVRTLLVEDCVTTGGTLLQGHEAVLSTGATVSGIVSLVDRGDILGRHCELLGLPYCAVVTYSDLGIDPVRLAPPTEAAHAAGIHGQDERVRPAPAP